MVSQVDSQLSGIDTTILVSLACSCRERLGGGFQTPSSLRILPDVMAV